MYLYLSVWATVASIYSIAMKLAKALQMSGVSSVHFEFMYGIKYGLRAKSFIN